MKAKVCVFVELDQDLLTQIDQARGEVALPRMLGIIIRLGFNAMKALSKDHSQVSST